MQNNYYLAIFKTKNKAVFLYSILENIGYKNFALVSAPCNIRVGCNYAIRFKNKNYIDIILKESDNLDIDPPEIYLGDSSRGGFKYKKITIY